MRWDVYHDQVRHLMSMAQQTPTEHSGLAQNAMSVDPNNSKMPSLMS
jgi:hypothetical protein